MANIDYQGVLAGMAAIDMPKGKANGKASGKSRDMTPVCLAMPLGTYFSDSGMSLITASDPNNTGPFADFVAVKRYMTAPGHTVGGQSTVNEIKAVMTPKGKIYLVTAPRWLWQKNIDDATIDTYKLPTAEDIAAEAEAAKIAAEADAANAAALQASAPELIAMVVAEGKAIAEAEVAAAAPTVSLVKKPK